MPNGLKWHFHQYGGCKCKFLTPCERGILCALAPCLPLLLCAQGVPTPRFASFLFPGASSKHSIHGTIFMCQLCIISTGISAFYCEFLSLPIQVYLQTCRTIKLYTAFSAVNGLHDPVKIVSVLLCGGFARCWFPCNVLSGRHCVNLVCIISWYSHQPLRFDSLAVSCDFLVTPAMMSSSIDAQYANLIVDWPPVNVLRPAVYIAHVRSWPVYSQSMICHPSKTHLALLRYVQLWRNLPLSACRQLLSSTRMNSIVQRAVCVEDTPSGGTVQITQHLHSTCHVQHSYLLSPGDADWVASRCLRRFPGGQRQMLFDTR